MLTVILTCEFLDDCAAGPDPVIELEDGAILERGGKGGSVTSDSVRGGIGARAGGKSGLATFCKRPPIWTGSM